MRIEARGNGADRPLVLLHGLASTPRCWDRTLPAIVAERRVLLVDLFDDADTFFSLEGSAQKLAAELARSGAGPADLIGHSMGGLVALLVAAHWPHLVARLVLVGVPALPLPSSAPWRIVAVARSSMQRDASAVGLVLGCVLRRSPVRLLSATRATMRANLEREVAAASDTPTLLVWGARDTIVPVAIAEGLARRMPTAQLVVIPDSGHQPMWEAPAAFNRVLLAFLRAGDSLSVDARAAAAPRGQPPAG